jgi:hypothetical protein
MTQARILYVHGAGNRATEATQNAQSLRERLAIEDRPDLLAASTWGETLAPDARLPRLDQALPPAAAAQAFGVPPGATSGTTLPDALAPLRELAGPQAFDITGVQARPDDADRLLAFLALGGLDLSGAGLTADDLAGAAGDVAASGEYQRAQGAPEAVIEATATSVVARAMERRSLASGDVSFGVLDVGWIGARVSDIAEALIGAGAIAAVGAWAMPTLTAALSLWASRKLAAERARAMHARVLPAVDVLYYQRHGRAIREHVRAEIERLDRPRLVMGHSLGGIILVDALFGPGAAPLDIALLVTFGSQSAFLSAFGGTDGVTPNVPWLNIWATYDFASFLGGPTWPGVVEDRELVVDVGFPAAHGAYYSAEGFGEIIRKHPGAAAVFA